jgi:hypothetical protein
MKFLILSPSGNVYYCSDSIRGLVTQCMTVRLDYKQRRVVYSGKPDGVVIGDDYSDVELDRELAARALVLLKRAGYTLYEQRD